MGTNFDPTSVSSGFQTENTLNTTFADIKTALSRMLNIFGDSDTGTNQMSVDLDMNSQHLINTAEPTEPTHLITKQYAEANYNTAAADGAAIAAAASAAEAAASAVVAGLARKNKAINGNFGVNQREVSGTVVLAVGEYGHDRFKGGASGCTYTFATSANVTTVTITAGSLMQVVEGVNLFSGSHVLSWSGTAQGKIGAGSYASSGVTGAATGGTNLSIEFNTGTLSKVQLEENTEATNFEHSSAGAELALCHRYARELIDQATGVAYVEIGQAISTTEAKVTIKFQGMRGIPTVILSAASTFALLDAAGASLTCTSLSTDLATKEMAIISAVVASGLVAGNASFLRGDATPASALLDAEL